MRQRLHGRTHGRAHRASLSLLGLGVALSVAMIFWAVNPAAAATRGNIATTATCTDTWTSASNGDWFGGGNWSSGSPPSSTDNACITTPGTYTVTMSGNATVNSLSVGASSGTQTLAIQGDPCIGSAVLTLNSGGSNGGSGDIVLTSSNPGSCSGADDASLVVGPGSLLNTGTIESNPGVGGGRFLEASITNSGGTIELNTNTSYNGNGTEFDNSGIVSLADGVELDLPSGAGALFVNHPGGIIAEGVGSEVFVDTGNVFDWNAGTITGGQPVIVRGALIITGTAAGSFVIQGPAATFSGNVSSKQNLTIESVGCDFDTTLTASAGFNNSGHITLTSVGGSCGQNTILAVSNGTLKNTGTLEVDQGTAPGVRAFQASPQGTPPSLNNKGTIRVGSGATFNLVGTLTNYSSASNTLTGGTYALTGILDYVNPSFDASGIVTNAASIVLTGSGAGIVDENKADGLRNLSSSVASGSLTLTGGASRSTAGAFTNNGKLILGSADTLTVGGGGGYTQGSTGVLTTTLGPVTASGQVLASGMDALAGSLVITRTGGFLPPLNTSFQILTYGSATGQFTKITGTAAGTKGLFFVIDYGPSGASLVVSKPSITLMPTHGPSGSLFTVSGKGFSPNETVTIKFGTTTLSPATANSSGSFTSPFETVPTVGSGSHKVTASGQESFVSAQATFHVP